MDPDRRTASGASFWEELRRRGVGRVGGVYVAAAFVALQLGEIVLPAFAAPDWVLQSLVVVAFLGLPVALALSWVFDLTPEGLRRESPLERSKGGIAPRLALLGVAAVSVGLGALWFGRDAGSAPADGSDPGTRAGAAAPATRGREGGDEADPIVAIAVLPLADFSADEDYFARQLHEELIGQLIRSTSLRVVPRLSVARYETSDKPLPEIAAELGVQALVTGSVATTADSDSVRISVQLLHASSDRHLLSRRYQREMKDILRLQTEVAAEIARAVLGELEGEAAPDRRVAAVDPEAHRALLRGQDELEARTPEGLNLAAVHFRTARDADSTFAPAWAQLAGTRVLMGLEGMSLLPDALEQAVREVRRAAELGGAEVEVGAVATLMDRLLSQAPDSVERRFRIELASIVGPGFSEDSVARMHALASTRIGRRGRSPSPAQRARRLLEAGRYDSAAAVYAAIARDASLSGPAPDWWAEHEAAHWLAGDYASAAGVLADRIRATEGDTPEAAALLARLGPGERAATDYWSVRERYESLKLERGDRVSRTARAVTAIGLEDVDGALDHLERALDEGDLRFAAMRNSPVWDPIRRDPRFRRIVAAAGAALLRRGGRDAPAPPAGARSDGPT